MHLFVLALFAKKRDAVALFLGRLCGEGGVVFDDRRVDEVEEESVISIIGVAFFFEVVLHEDG
jgi:hypothetical protein